MVQGLGFLSKKSWHTKNMAVQEKVWVAEERQRQEAQKTSELAKQIVAERQQDELAKIAGVETKKDRGIDWMYNGHKKDSETAQADADKQSEAYLLGQQVSATQKVQGDLDVATNEGVNLVVSRVATTNKPLHAEDSVAARNEAFHVRVEDPMFGVTLQAARQEQEWQHRQELYQSAGLELVEKKKKKDKKKKKKSSKDKKQKKSKRRRSYSSDEDSYDERRRRRRSESPERRPRHRSNSPARRRSRSRSPMYDRRRSPPDRYHASVSHRRQRRSPSYDQKQTSRSRDNNRRSPSYDRYQHCRRSPSPYDRRHRHDKSPSPYERPPPPVQDEFGRQRPPAPIHRTPGYGLQGHRGSTAQHTDLGPDRQLLQRKRDQTRQQKQRVLSTKQPKRYTAAERAAAVQAMQHDARSRTLPTRPTEQDIITTDQNPSASFLRDMHQTQYGLK